jgi:hypothetical protein
MIDAALHDQTEQKAVPGVPTSWEELQLHAWLTVAVLYGDRRPAKAKGSVSDGTARAAQIRAMLGLAESDARIVPDVLGNQLTVDNGIVEKMLSDTYRGRVPYLR